MRASRAGDVPGPNVVAPSSSSDKACAKAIVQDWYPDSVVDRAFPLRCYGMAIAILPGLGGPHYSTVREDIERAHATRYLEVRQGQRLC